MNPPSLILLRGLPGAGKSTLATLLATMPGAVAVCADDYPGRYTLERNAPVYNADMTEKALGWCWWQVSEHMERGAPVIIVHNTFIRRDDLLEYEHSANLHGYRLFVVKVEGRHPSVHCVPEDVVQAMDERYEEWGTSPMVDELD